MIRFSIASMCKSSLIAIFVFATLGFVSASAMSFDCSEQRMQKPSEYTYQIAARNQNQGRGSCAFSPVSQMNCCTKAALSLVGNLQRLEYEFEFVPPAFDVPWHAENLISKPILIPYRVSKWVDHGPAKNLYLTTQRLRI